MDFEPRLFNPKNMRTFAKGSDVSIIELVVMSQKLSFWGPGKSLPTQNKSDPWIFFQNEWVCKASEPAGAHVCPRVWDLWKFDTSVEKILFSQFFSKIKTNQKLSERF